MIYIPWLMELRLTKVHSGRFDVIYKEVPVMKDKIIKWLKIIGYVVTAAIGFLSGLQF